MKKILSSALGGLLFTGALIAVGSAPAGAATTTTVYETTASSEGWSEQFQRGTGSLDWTADGLTFSTPDSNAKYAFGTEVSFPLENLGELSYEVVHGSDGSNVDQRVAVNVEGTYAGKPFILIFEPLYTYERPISGDAQSFDAVLGGTAKWWTNTDGIAGFPKASSYTPLDEVKQLMPGATVQKVSLNQGGGNAGLSDTVSSFTLNGQTWLFEEGAPPVVLTTTTECKSGVWKTSELPVFKNQGDCVSSFASAKNGKR